MLEKLFHLKFHGCFLTHTKTARSVVPLIVLGKWKVFDGLKTHPKKNFETHK